MPGHRGRAERMSSEYRIIGATLIDGLGGTSLPDAEVHVSGDKIKYAGPRRTDEWAGKIYDASGCTVMPGLIDCHVHLLADSYVERDADGRSGLAGSLATDSYSLTSLKSIKRAEWMVDGGFTTVRDLLAPNEPIFALRDSAAQGVIHSPRIVASGKCITITAGHGTAYGVDMAWPSDSIGEIKRHVRTQAQLGADVIKLMATTRSYVPPFRASIAFSPEELQAIVETARTMGLLVAAHCQNAGPEGIRLPAEAGVHSIEHGRPLDDAAAAMMAEKGTYYVPTLAVRFTASESLARGKETWPRHLWSMIPRQHADMLVGMELARKHGVKIALGTDAGVSGVHHIESARELEYLCESGLSPMEAIISGTRLAAETVGLGSRTGVLEADRLADVLVVRGDPLKEVKLLQDRDKIVLVTVGGRVQKDLLSKR